jgi:hypothetical protein
MPDELDDEDDDEEEDDELPVVDVDAGVWEHADAATPPAGRRRAAVVRARRSEGEPSNMRATLLCRC